MPKTPWRSNALGLGRNTPSRSLTPNDPSITTAFMRITLTIHDDVAAAIRRLRRLRKASLKAIVNEALRRGIRDMTRKRPRTVSGTRSVSLGSLLIPNLDNIGEVLASAEGENFK
jgi:hypothetical protein